MTKKIAACFIIKSVQQKEPIRLIDHLRKNPLSTGEVQSRSIELNCSVIAVKICCIAKQFIFEKSGSNSSNSLKIVKVSFGGYHKTVGKKQ